MVWKVAMNMRRISVRLNKRGSEMPRVFARSQSGFTLIEIMLVVFIVAVMALGISIVATGDRLPAKISQEAQKLQSSIRQLQTFAMTHRQLYGLSFNSSGWSTLMIQPAADYLEWGLTGASTASNTPGNDFNQLPTSANNDSGLDDSDAEQAMPWRPVESKKSVFTVDKGLAFELFLGNEQAEDFSDENTGPHILFSPQGEVTPFLIILRGAGTNTEVMYEGLVSGELKRVTNQQDFAP